MSDKKSTKPTLMEEYFEVVEARREQQESELNPDEGLTKYAPPNHHIFGRGIIEKGKTKKFRMYKKGFTYKSYECLWKNVEQVGVNWTENITTNGLASMGTETLKINIWCIIDDKSEIIDIKFKLFSFLVPLDWTKKNQTIVDWLFMICNENNINFYRF
jgi:hypothetical protein